MKPPVTVKHFCNIGDIVASLAAMKTLSEKTKRRVRYCQQLDVPATYYGENVVHPTIDDKGIQVMCNQKMFDMMRPLLLAQDYIEDMQVFNGQLINVDLDVIRKEKFVNLPNQAIQQWLFMAYPDMAYDLSKSWMEVGEVDMTGCELFYPELATAPIPFSEINISDYCILNFTERYRNPHIHYYFLNKYKNGLIFAGTEREYLSYCQKWGLKNVPRLVVKDFLQLAYAIKNSRFIYGNQSFVWNCAEAMKSPRLLELCEFAPNCQPFIGEHSYGYLHQTAAEHYFKTLMTR